MYIQFVVLYKKIFSAFTFWVKSFFWVYQIDFFCSAQLFQSECWLKLTLQSFSLIATEETCTQHCLKLQLGKNPWKATTVAVTSPHTGAGCGDKNTQTLNPHRWHFTLWQCGPIRIRYCNSGSAHIQKSTNPKTTGFWDSNTSYNKKTITRCNRTKCCTDSNWPWCHAAISSSSHLKLPSGPWQGPCWFLADPR